MVIYSYVITRDFGFAPNPFCGVCTLATCKPIIRKTADVGDWVIGTGSNSKKYKMGNRLIYAMKVEEIISTIMYWEDTRFKNKKPVMNGSKKQKYGDNIYYFDKIENKLVQVDSHHSLENGKTNEKNYKKDISGKNVLVSSYFWYFGESAPMLPEEIAIDVVKAGMGHKKITESDIVNKFVTWLSSNFEMGYNGHPWFLRGSFNRYDGN